MAIILFSTQIYIYKVSRNQVISRYDYFGDYVLNIKLSTKHIMTGSLINISMGGIVTNLKDNIDRWREFIAEDYCFGHVNLNSTLLSQLPYSQGIWLNWGTSGEGVSSTFSEFILNISGMEMEVDLSFEVNITTSIMITGSYSVLGGESKAVTVILKVFNEGAPALKKNSTLTYQKSGSWEDPTVLVDYSALDYGNGTYLFSFTDTIPGIQVPVHIQVNDIRGIFVQAEVNLTEG
jgi:hypothetical protein